MRRSSNAQRRGAPWVGYALAAGLGITAFGALLGYLAIQTPSLNLGPTENDSISVWVSSSNVAPYVEWSVAPDGTVSITTYIGGSEINEDDTVVSISLGCDARFRSYDVDGELSDRVEPKEGGNSADCEKPLSPTAANDPAFQTFALHVSTQVSATITGRPERDWSSSWLGLRVARAPTMVLITSTGVAEASPVKANMGDFVPAATGSTLRKLALSDEAESVSLATPQDDREASLTIGIDYVDWLSTFDEETQSGNSSPAGLVRWSNPDGQAASQMLTLFAGVLVGAGASFLVEVLFWKWREGKK